MKRHVNLKRNHFKKENESSPKKNSIFAWDNYGIRLFSGESSLSQPPGFKGWAVKGSGIRF